MSEENIGIGRRGYDAYNRGDLKGIVALMAPDATFHPLPSS
jgi:ketosteroid isomerase-like protein